MQSWSLSGIWPLSSPVFRRTDSLAFLAASLARLAIMALSSMAFATAGCSSKYVDSCSDHNIVHQGSDIGVAQLLLGLALKLGLRQLHGNNC